MNSFFCLSYSSFIVSNKKLWLFICYAVVNLLLPCRQAGFVAQKTLSLSDSFNIIPFTSDKVKRFFKIFSIFFNFFYFFQKESLLCTLFSIYDVIYYIICRARKKGNGKVFFPRRLFFGIFICNRCTFCSFRCIFCSFFLLRNTYPPNNPALPSHRSRDISLRLNKILRVRQTSCRIERIYTVKKAFFFCSSSSQYPLFSFKMS